MIAHKCTRCGADMKSTSGLAGQVDLCPACGAECRVPANEATAQPAFQAAQPTTTSVAGPAGAPSKTPAAVKPGEAAGRRKWLFVAGGAAAAIAVTAGIWALVASGPQDTSGPYGTGAGRHYVSDEFCGTWKLRRTTKGTEPFTRGNRAYEQPVTIEKLSAVIDQPEDADTKNQYVIRTRSASGTELDIAERSADGIHWGNAETQGDEVFTLDGPQLKLSWQLMPSAKPIEAWYDRLTDTDVLSGQGAASDKAAQREYVAAVRQIESDEIHLACVQNQALERAAAGNKAPRELMVMVHPDAMWKRFELELLHAGKLIVPGSDPAIRVSAHAYRRTVESLLEIAPEYKDRVGPVMKLYVTRCLKEMSGASAHVRVAEQVAEAGREHILRLALNEFAGVAREMVGQSNNMGASQVILDDLREYDPAAAQALAGEVQKRMGAQTISYTPWRLRRAGTSRRPRTDWDRTLAKCVAPAAREALSKRSPEELNKPLNGPTDLPSRLCLFLLISPLFEGPDLTDQDVADFRTHFAGYAKMMHGNIADTIAFGFVQSHVNMRWGSFISAALKHPDKLLPVVLGEVPQSTTLSLALLYTREFTDADMKKVCDAVYGNFARVVGADAREVGLKTKGSPTRGKDFLGSCMRRWPGIGIDWILRTIVTGKQPWGKQDDLAFAVAWADDQLRVGARWISVGKYGLQDYLKSFPSGKHAALAKAWMEAK